MNTFPLNLVAAIKLAEPYLVTGAIMYTNYGQQLEYKAYEHEQAQA